MGHCRFSHWRRCGVATLLGGSVSFVKSGERNVQFVLFLFTIALSTNILPATTLTLTLLAAVVLGFILYMLVCVRRDKMGENSKN